MVNGKSAVAARTKARQAKAALDAQRAEHDRLVVDAATEFYEAADALAAAQAAVAAAEQQRMRSVARLSQLGQTDDQVATLCDLPVKDVRELRRRSAAAEASSEIAAAVDTASVGTTLVGPPTTKTAAA